MLGHEVQQQCENDNCVKYVESTLDIEDQALGCVR